MLNFQFYNPVNIVFGKDTISNLTELIPAESKVMMLYGGGSIKKNGVYDQAIKALDAFEVVEFSGIEPNPKFETCMEAVEIARRENVNFLLAVGGGSVLDGTKFIAAAIKYTKGNPWDILLNNGVEPLADAVPLGAIITLPATGSEMNCNAVVSRKETKDKRHFADPLVFPKFSIIDPQVTFSLPERQTINGVVDSFVHTCEQYMTFEVNTPLQDRMAESLLKTLIENGSKVMNNPSDYDTRANLFWCATMALNGIIAVGVQQDWSTHMIGHELTAIYGLDHAQTLAVVMPALWRHQRQSKAGKLLQYGREVWNISDQNESNAIDSVITRTEEFFHSIKMKTKLSDYGIDAKEAAEEVRRRFAEREVAFGENLDIDSKAAYEIISDCK